MSREVRDAIHGLIVLQPNEWNVIDSQPFQRLRGIQQLALTNLLYPSARHSRFEHSIGVAHVAGRLADRLNQETAGLVDTELVRLAALVHDIGHGPFSHVSEEVMERHEHVSAAIVRYHPQLIAAIGDDRAAKIADLLLGKGTAAKRSIERDIIAGPADADKFDYLLRDSHFCGVEYGRYDLGKVVESARAVPLTNTISALGFHKDSVFALEEMVLARHHMHRQVYGHRTRIATDRMLVKALELGIEEGHLPPSVFHPEGDLDDAFVEEFLKWDDAAVARELSENDGRGGELMRSLQSRRLYKRIFQLGEEELAKHYSQFLAGAIAVPQLDDLPGRVARLESRIAESVGIAPHWVKLWWTALVNPLSSRPSSRIEDREIVLIDDHGEHCSFDKASEVFHEKSELPSRNYVSLYARHPEKEFDDAEKASMKAVALEGLREIGNAQYEV